ncbi:alpha/beta hydrolase [Pseudomonas carassii]|uniref:Alpha/beta fold hydrolase n=1 Tax=Pseudomonas carassii TaxID=3115855 RepID=A0ABU7HHM7_9PSED|nr:alpha/beta fold hydrolase [Pseudomonas sp. 137P]MEE1890691.1 alpha/beta fold hydrolase [Pseudomonas sp. 137P]
MPVTFNRENLAIAVNGITLDAWLYLPEAPGPLPLVLMSPGFAALKGQALDRFAEHFAATGLAVVLFDQRNFGHSGGEPRGEIDPRQQLDDLREVLTWACAQPRFDARRIGVWGSSYSGGHALQLAAWDRRVRCVVAQVPTISGHQSFLRRAGEHVYAMREAFARDRAARHAGGAPGYRRVIAEAGEAGIYAGADAEAFYGTARALQAGWDNRVTLRSSELASEYEPGLTIERISPTPLLMLVAERDTVTPADLALAAYNRAGEPKRLVVLPDGHFDPYQRHFQAAAQAAGQWFLRHLG